MNALQDDMTCPKNLRGKVTCRHLAQWPHVTSVIREPFKVSTRGYREYRRSMDWRDQTARASFVTKTTIIMRGCNLLINEKLFNTIIILISVWIVLFLSFCLFFGAMKVMYKAWMFIKIFNRNWFPFAFLLTYWNSQLEYNRI